MENKPQRSIFLLVAGGLIALFFLPNAWNGVLYWWFEFTHPSTWLSPRYWILGTIYSAAIAGTSLMPLYIAWEGGQWVRKTQQKGSTRVLLILCLIVCMVVVPVILGLVAGYIGPNYLQEFYTWLYI